MRGPPAALEPTGKNRSARAADLALVLLFEVFVFDVLFFPPTPALNSRGSRDPHHPLVFLFYNPPLIGEWERAQPHVNPSPEILYLLPKTLSNNNDIKEGEKQTCREITAHDRENKGEHNQILPIFWSTDRPRPMVIDVIDTFFLLPFFSFAFNIESWYVFFLFSQRPKCGTDFLLPTESWE